MRKRTRLASLLLAVCMLLSVVLTGCGGGDANNTADSTTTGSKTVTVAMTGDVNTWNPWMYNEIGSRSGNRVVYL